MALHERARMRARPACEGRVRLLRLCQAALSWPSRTRHTVVRAPLQVPTRRRRPSSGRSRAARAGRATWRASAAARPRRCLSRTHVTHSRLRADGWCAVKSVGEHRQRRPDGLESESAGEWARTIHCESGKMSGGVCQGLMKRVERTLSLVCRHWMSSEYCE